jgi:hypothetical protein
MRLIKPKFEIIDFQTNLENKKDLNTLSHETVYLYTEFLSPLTDTKYMNMIGMYKRYLNNRDSVAICLSEDHYKNQVYITTNSKVILENSWEKDLNYTSKPTEYHEKRYTVKFTCSNNFYNLLTSKYWYTVRNFDISKDINIKDEELTFIIPYWLPNITLEGKYIWNCFCDIDTYGPSKDCFSSKEEYLKRKDTDFLENTPEGLFILSLLSFEFTYKELMKIKPVKVTYGILPNSLKIELFISGFESDWKKLFNIVKDEELKELLDPLKEEFIKNNYINE